MKHTLISLFLALVILCLAFIGCTQKAPVNQIEFGIQSARNNLWEEAIFRWKKTLEKNPNSAAAHNNLAVAYEKKGLWNEAEREYKQALSLSPGNRYIKSNYKNFQKLLDPQEEEKDKKKENEKK